LLATSNPSIDSIVRDDILASIATAIDLAALHGTGSSQPTGIANISGVGTVLLSANGLAINNATAYPALVSLESALGAANADQGSMAYLLRASIRGVLRTQTQFSSTDTPVYTSAPGNVDGVINGYRAAISNQVANNLTTGTATTITTPIFFGNWNELLIGNFNGGATDLVVDPYTLAANSVVRVIARQWVDINVRHPASFALLGGILGG
jgi:HK97 family phage major capsid protein